jgi:hypothetical protein
MRRGETMTGQIVQTEKFRNPIWAERKQDLLLVSSFGLWAVLLGFAPVVAVHLILAS